MKKNSIVFKIIWSIALILIGIGAYLIYAPMRPEEFIRYIFMYNFILAPILVVISGIVFKQKLYFVVPITALIFTTYNFVKGILIYYSLLEPHMEASFMNTISYAFGTNGEYFLDFIFTKVLFFIWLTVYTITCYVFDLVKYLSKINLKRNRIVEE